MTDQFSGAVADQECAFTSLVDYFAQQPSQSIAHNIKTTAVRIQHEAISVCATVNEREYHNSHVCSPFAVYIHYPRLILKQHQNFWIKTVLATTPRLLGGLFKLAQFNQVVQLNNRFTADNSFSFGISRHIETLRSIAIERYPHHTVLLRRVNESTHPGIMHCLKKAGFLLMPERPVHIFHPDNAFMKKSHTKRDLALLKKSRYQIATHDTITASDIPRIHQLYHWLFLQKHTESNPDFTEDFFMQSWRQHWLEFYGLRNEEGVIDAFWTTTQTENILYCGPIGYDTHQPQDRGLYRMLVAAGLSIAWQKRLIFNYGSGSDRFKINRGSTKVIEYIAVYNRHLPGYRRLPWKVIQFFAKRFLPILFRQNSL